VKTGVVTLPTVIFKQLVGTGYWSCLVNPVVVPPVQQRNSDQHHNSDHPTDPAASPADRILVASQFHIKSLTDRIMNALVNHLNSPFVSLYRAKSIINGLVYV
jgi:hypothetical protein